MGSLLKWPHPQSAGGGSALSGDPAPPGHLLPVDPILRTSVALAPADVGAKGPSPLHFSINCLSASPAWLLRMEARSHVPSQFPGTQGSDSYSGMIYNHLVFSARTWKMSHPVEYQLHSLSQKAAAGDVLQTCRPSLPPPLRAPHFLKQGSASRGNQAGGR